MRTIRALLTITFFAGILVLFTGLPVSAQQSDYQIQQQFQSEYEQLLQEIETAVTTDELNELQSRIDSLQTRYSDQSELINSALYPNSFEGLVSELRSSYSSTMEDVSTIEQLNERIEDLLTEMDTFRERLEDLRLERVSLQEELQRVSENEARQAALIEEFQSNLQQRNVFISEFLEQILTRYQSMDSAVQADLSEAVERLEENPIDVINNIIEEYITLLGESESLETPDYISMQAQHSYFSNVWDQIGQRFSTTFMPESPEETYNRIESLLNEWGTGVDSRIWSSLQGAFRQNGVELQDFNSSDEFYSALNTYLDSAIETSMETNSEADFRKYQSFNEFWNQTFKAEWGNLIVEGDVLSQTQISAIDAKVMQWQSEAETTSNITFILLLVSVAVIIGLIVLLLTRKPS